MQNLNERGAAYIPIAEARGVAPHSDNTNTICPARQERRAKRRANTGKPPNFTPFYVRRVVEGVPRPSQYIIYPPPHPMQHTVYNAPIAAPKQANTTRWPRDRQNWAIKRFNARGRIFVP